MEDTEGFGNPLVSCGWLAEHLDDSGVRVIEVSATPSDAAYREGHISGAVWWYWKDALWHPTDREFATPEEFAHRLGAIGVTPETTVILCGSPVQFGTYAFWVFMMAGHRKVRLLDGGRKRWRAEGRSFTQEAPNFAAVDHMPGNRDDSSRVGRDEIRAKLGRPGRTLLDVRSPEEYRGERVSPPPGEGRIDLDHGAERTGRIPGAVHLFFRDLVNEDDTFLSPDQLRNVLNRGGINPESDQEIVTYCRLSHRASLSWFAMRYLLGIEKVRVYDGSWTEWGSIVGFPIER